LQYSFEEIAMYLLETVEEFVIFGAGDQGKELLHRMKHCGRAPVCYCDNNEGLWGRQIGSVLVLSPAQATKSYPDAVYLITVFNHTAEVREQLQRLAIEPEKIHIWTREQFLSPEDRKQQLAKEAADREWWEKASEEIKGFAGKYMGNRCFIIGNGGSLTVKDLELLTGEYTFGSNRLYKLYQKTDWRPTFYCFYDRMRAELLVKDFQELAEGCEYIFTSADLREVLGEEILSHPRVRFLKIKKEKYYPQLPKFSERADQVIYDGQTVLYIATQLAVYMGFQELYYLGADNHYSVELKADGSIRRDQTVRDYPIEIGEIDLGTSVIPQIELTTMSFEASQKYAQSHALKIYNVTRGGSLEVFPRKKLEEVLGR